LTTVLVLKLCLVPSLIYLVTLAGRRWGPNAAGWLSALPIVAGPILLTMAIEQGSGFVATAAAHTLIAVIAVLVFCLAYAWPTPGLPAASAFPARCWRR
jgi:chromate transport protein ChrA